MRLARDDDVHEDPLTGQRFRTLRSGAATSGELLRTELWIEPGGRIPAHIHPHQEERFEVLHGKVRFRIAGKAHLANDGDVVIVPAGTRQSATNDSDHEAHLIIEVRPALELQQALETLAALARSGKFTRHFLPKTPAALLKLGVVANRYHQTVYVASPPLAVQRVLFKALAALGHRLGYHLDH